jgi:phosphate/sulfate permease
MEIYTGIAIVLSIFYGFVIGQNDAANSFGDWIGARVGSVRTGLILCAIFAFAGAYFEGGKVIKTIDNNEQLIQCLEHEKNISMQRYRAYIG